jgi:hypothetical protein
VSASAHLIIDLPFGVMLLLIVAAVLLHVVYLAFNAAGVALLRLEPPESSCVLLMASQKASPFGRGAFLGGDAFGLGFRV